MPSASPERRHFYSEFLQRANAHVGGAAFTSANMTIFMPEGVDRCHVSCPAHLTCACGRGISMQCGGVCVRCNSLVCQVCLGNSAFQCCRRCSIGFLSNFRSRLYKDVVLLDAASACSCPSWDRPSVPQSSVGNVAAWECGQCSRCPQQPVVEARMPAAVWVGKSSNSRTET